MAPPLVHTEHFFYIDVAAAGYNQQSIKYINTFREPYTQFVSHYYYRQELHNTTMTLKGCHNLTITQCFEQGLLGEFRMTTLEYFCGQHPMCKWNETFALERSIEHVKNQYIAVGLLEHMDVYLSVLENLLPMYFTGAKREFDYLQETDDGHAHQREIPRADESEDAKKFVKATLARDYDFYEFVKARLFRQFNQIDNEQ